MAKAIVRIKTGTSASPSTYNATNGTGLTFAELGARIQNNFNSLYIGSDNQPIMIGAEVSDDVTLSSNSQYKIPTQGAVKTYVDNIISSSQFTRPFFVSRILSAPLVFPETSGVPFGFKGVLTIPWTTSDVSSGSSPIEYISYDGSFTNSLFVEEQILYNGAFRNSSNTTIRINVIYQIMWSQEITDVPDDKILQKCQWIETYEKTSLTTIQQTGTYGFSTMVLTPILNNIEPALDGIVNASAIFTLAPDERFIIKTWDVGRSGASILPSNNLVQSKATRIQIVGI